MPRFEHIDWPIITKLPLKPEDTVEGKCWTFATYFDSCKIVQIAQGVHLIESGLLKKTYLELFRDIWTLIQKHYLHFNKDEVFPAKTYGSYFPKLFADPTKYI